MTNTDNASVAGMESLRKALEKATPGPWLYRAKSNSFHKPPPEGTKYTYGESIIELSNYEDETPQQIADMDFLLAAVNPETIRALLDASRLLAEKEAEIAELQSLVKAAYDYLKPRVGGTGGVGDSLLPRLHAALKP